MKKIFGITIVLIFMCSIGNAQPISKILRSNTKNISVREGHNFYKDYWGASPEVKKDIYYAHRFKQKSRITFYSDVDSVSFDVTPRKTYEFIILLNGKDSCHTELSTIRSTYFKDCVNCKIANDTIPFTLGFDNRIYFTGTVNGSRPLKFFFDDGADNTILFPSAFEKEAKLKFDGEVMNRAGDLQSRKVSEFNNVQLSKLKWKNEEVMYINKKIGEGDGTIGYNLFEDKLIEFDYEKKLMIIHDKPFNPGSEYSKWDMQLHGGEVPSVDGTVIIGAKKITADFLFDMGATGCLFLNQGFLKKNNLYGTMQVINRAESTGGGNRVIKTELSLLPEFIFGNYEIKWMPVNLENAAEDDPGTGVLGMDLLKRFNTILDYQNNLIYLKPNSLMKGSFKGMKN